ncbi:hypothetical protein DSO57_1026998 [Entomophthora muscae]|uniref:Uncharacterized protein n=1 Tax=Entomophthora muscae TaxID=34485 RepID=A0ACC2TNY4_9FUNG|nr:hypothetical protein DSO57_1026998 [Entomophthora muscae]
MPSRYHACSAYIAFPSIPPLEIVNHFVNVTKLLLNCSKCLIGVARKLIYGLKKLRFLKVESIEEGDSLFDGPALEISSFHIRLQRNLLSKPIYFLLTSLPCLSHLTIDFCLRYSISGLPKQYHLQSLNIKKSHLYTTYLFLLNLYPNLVSLGMPTEDHQDYRHALQESYPQVNSRALL